MRPTALPTRVLALVLALMLTLSACAGAEEPPEGYDPAQVRAGLAALFAGDHPESRDTEAGACFAERLVDATTPSQLQEAGVLDDRYAVVRALPTLEEGFAREWVDAQWACTDFVAESTRAQVKVTKGRLSPKAYEACLREAMSDDDLREAVVETLTGQWDGVHVDLLAVSQRNCVAGSQGG